MPYEHRSQKLLAFDKFLVRLLQHWLAALALLVFSLGLGTLGFHLLVEQPWLIAFLNSSMLLGGMGPVGDVPATSGGQLFAAFYALYAGLVFLAVASIMLAPVAHRILHQLHLEADDDKEDSAA